MNEVFVAWGAAAVVAVVVDRVMNGKKRRAEREEREREEQARRAAEQAEREALEKERVFQEVYLAYTRLEKQRARGYGPWLPCIIDRRGCPAPVALTALRWTKNELLGRRFDLSCLDEDIESLEMGV